MRLGELHVSLPGLPAELAGLRLLHLSDFHLGPRSPGSRAFRRATEWAASRPEPDVVAITGDLLSSPRGAELLKRGLGRLRARAGVLAILGNHDVGISRDPFSSRVSIDLSACGVALLEDAGTSFERGGRRVQVVGVSPAAYMRRSASPAELADPDADLRILLCHFPRVVDRFDCSRYQLVLVGHMHGGQICLPLPTRKIRFAHLRARYPEGVYRVGGSTLVVSRGLGTTFVPFRFFARPEATELVLVSEPG